MKCHLFQARLDARCEPRRSRWGSALARGRGWIRGILWALLWIFSALAVEAGEPRAALFPALDLGVEHLEAGEVLLAELNCTACHEARAEVVARLRPKPAPLLGTAAERLRPAYVRSWLLDPLRVKPGTTMPDLLHRVAEPERAAAAEELTQFLWSLTTHRPPAPLVPGQLQLQQGRILYHQTGCVACHPPYESAAAIFGHAGGGPTDPDAVRFVLAQLQQTSQPFPNLAAKYQPPALAEFLVDPLEVRPGGRMPSFKLTEAEAKAIAAYLQAEHARQPGFSGPGTGLVLDEGKAGRGRERFAALGCAACHELGDRHPRIRSELKAKPLADLRPNATGGCLSVEPSAAAPRYALSDAQRTALREVLQNPAKLGQALTPSERVAHSLASLNCYACHSRSGLGGPGASRSDFFNTLSESDLGDEGRLPPHLSSVGHKLPQNWLGEVLTNAGVVRPYMAVRMPQFGSRNVGHLVGDFIAADALPEARDAAPPGDVKAGAELVGLGGNSCVNCHRFGSHPSLGLSVMDMTRMAERLNWDWFRRYLLDPASLRPGTRMPAFWPEGQAAVTNILEGDTAKQIAAIWAYLSLGADAPPPPGLLESLEKAGSIQPRNYE